MAKKASEQKKRPLPCHEAFHCTIPKYGVTPTIKPAPKVACTNTFDSLRGGGIGASKRNLVAVGKGQSSSLLGSSLMASFRRSTSGRRRGDNQEMSWLRRSVGFEDRIDKEHQLSKIGRKQLMEQTDNAPLWIDVMITDVQTAFTVYFISFEQTLRLSLGSCDRRPLVIILSCA